MSNVTLRNYMKTWAARIKRIGNDVGFDLFQQVARDSESIFYISDNPFVTKEAAHLQIQKSYGTGYCARELLEWARDYEKKDREMPKEMRKEITSPLMLKKCVKSMLFFSEDPNRREHTDLYSNRVQLGLIKNLHAQYRQYEKDLNNFAETFKQSKIQDDQFVKNMLDGMQAKRLAHWDNLLDDLFKGLKESSVLKQTSKNKIDGLKDHYTKTIFNRFESLHQKWIGEAIGLGKGRNAFLDGCKSYYIGVITHTQDRGR